MRIQGPNGEIVNVPDEHAQLVRDNIDNTAYINTLASQFKQTGKKKKPVKAQYGLPLYPLGLSLATGANRIYNQLFGSEPKPIDKASLFNYDEALDRATRYIGRPQFKGTTLKPEYIANGIRNLYNDTGYIMPESFILTQAQMETGLGTKLKSKNNFFNVGNYDNGQVLNYDDPQKAVDDYIKLIYNDYLLKGKKTIQDLMKDKGFVNAKGKRYASNPNYEKSIRDQYEFIDKFLGNSLKTPKANGGIIKAQAGMVGPTNQAAVAMLSNPAYRLNLHPYQKQYPIYHPEFYHPYTPGQNAAKGSAEPMVGLDDPIFNIVSLGYGLATAPERAFAESIIPKNPELGEPIAKGSIPINKIAGKPVSKLRAPEATAVWEHHIPNAKGVSIDDMLSGSASNEALELNKLKHFAQYGDKYNDALRLAKYPYYRDVTFGIDPRFSKAAAIEGWHSNRLSDWEAKLIHEQPWRMTFDQYFKNKLTGREALNQLSEGFYANKYGGSLSPAKAHEMLKDGTAHGKPLTDKQKRYFGYIYGSSKKHGGAWEPNKHPYKYSERMRINELNQMAYGGMGEHVTVYPMAMQQGGESNPYFPNPQGQYTSDRLNNFIGMVKESAQKAMEKDLQKSMLQANMGQSQDMDQDMAPNPGYAFGGSTPYQNGFTAGTGWLARNGGNLPKAQFAGQPPYEYGFNKFDTSSWESQPNQVSHSYNPWGSAPGNYQDTVYDSPYDMNNYYASQGDQTSDYSNESQMRFLDNQESSFDTQRDPAKRQQRQAARKQNRDLRRAMRTFGNNDYLNYIPNVSDTTRFSVKNMDQLAKSSKNWNEGTTSQINPESVRYGIFGTKKPTWWGGRRATSFDIDVSTSKYPQQPTVADRTVSENPVSTPDIDFQPGSTEVTGLKPAGPSMYTPGIEGSTIGKSGSLGSSNYDPTKDPASPSYVKKDTIKVGRKNWKDRWWADPDIANASMDLVTNFANRIDEKKKLDQLRTKTRADYLYAPIKGSRGDYTVNNGYFRPDQKVPVQYQGAAGSYFAQYGGSPADGIYMSDDEIATILANGGEIEYLD